MESRELLLPVPGRLDTHILRPGRVLGLQRGALPCMYEVA